MKRKLLLAILILLVLLLGIVLILMSYLGKKEIANTLSEEKLQEITAKLKSTSFLNSIYSRPEDIDMYYVLLSCKEEDNKAEDDDAEYVYLSTLDNQYNSLEELYPDIMNLQNLSASQKKARILQEIKAQLQAENAEDTEDNELGSPLLAYKKLNYQTAKNLILKEMQLSEEAINSILENLKTSSNLLYSDTYNCFYISKASGNNNAYDYNLKCISGINVNNKYTVIYTLELPDASKSETGFEVVFYEEPDGYKFVSNRCVTLEELQKKAEEFEKSLNNVKTVTDEEGNVYGFINSTSQDGGVQYYINGGKNKAYFKVCYVKTKTYNYFFTNDTYFYINQSESNKNFLSCYPRQIMNYDYTYLNENFTRVMKKTEIS